MDSNSKKIIAIMGVIFVLIALFAAFLANNNEEDININEPNNNSNLNNNDSEKIYVLKNHSRYFTINNCLNKYYGYIMTHKYDAVVNLLSFDFIKNNTITEENITNKITFYEGIYTVTLEKVYYQILKEGFSIYYTHAILTEDIMDADINEGEKIDVYHIVYLNESNLTFSIEPFKGDIFKGEINNE